MIFMCTYQVDRDKQADTQAFFANMTEEQIAGEHPDGVTQIGRWHDVLEPWVVRLVTYRSTWLTNSATC